MAEGEPRPLLDVAAHLPWPSDDVIWGYLEPEWQDYVGKAGSLPGGWGARPIHMENPYTAPGVPRGIGDPVDTGLGAELTVYVQEPGILIGAEPNPYLAREVARAANDWMLERWLRPDPDRRRAAIVVANQLVDAAVAEIERLAADPQFVAVQLGSTTFARPFGHPIHFPILAAAARHGLPVIVHADGDAALESPVMPNGAGMTATYGELEALSAQALMTQLTSFVAHGTFERLPELRVVLHGGSAGWLAPLLWRLDTNFKGLRREMPWTKRMPSEYVHDHIRLTTYPLDAPEQPELMRRQLAVHDDLGDIVCFASGRRHDAVAPASARACLPDAWHDRVLHDNAAAILAA